MAYLLDANVFIEGKNRYYGFDFCPGFWDWIDAANAAHRVFSIEKVGDEIPLTRHFYRHLPPPLEVIGAEIRALEEEIQRLPAEVTV